MLDVNCKLEQCSICRQEYTSTHVEVTSGFIVYVCENCIEAAKYNFIWICLNCGKVHIRPKALVIERIGDNELKKAYLLCQDVQIIQGIDMCIECDPQGIINFMKITKAGMDC
jgi:hypothetical protein